MIALSRNLGDVSLDDFGQGVAIFERFANTGLNIYDRFVPPDRPEGGGGGGGGGIDPATLLLLQQQAQNKPAAIPWPIIGAVAAGVLVIGTVAVVATRRR